MEKRAECRMSSACGMTAKAGRIVDGGTVSMRAVPIQSALSTEKLGGKAITLKLTGLSPDQTARVIRMIEALKCADSDEAARIVDELKGLSGGDHGETVRTGE